jgi:hypothetical protein
MARMVDAIFYVYEYEEFSYSPDRHFFSLWPDTTERDTGGAFVSNAEIFMFKINHEKIAYR